MPIASAFYDRLVRETAPAEPHPDDAPIAGLREPRGTLSTPSKAGTTADQARIVTKTLQAGGGAALPTPGPAVVAGSAGTTAPGGAGKAPAPVTLRPGLLVAPAVVSVVGNGSFASPQDAGIHACTEAAGGAATR